MQVAIPGQLEVSIRLYELPQSIVGNKRGYRVFRVDIGQGRIVAIKVRPGVWAKMEKANREYPMWQAFITGTMGQNDKAGFFLDNPQVRVCERKPKKPKK